MSSFHSQQSLRDAWGRFDSRFAANYSLTLRPFISSLPLTTSSHTTGAECFEGQLRRLFKLVEEHLSRRENLHKGRNKHRVERTCYIHTDRKGEHHAHLYIRKPQIQSTIDLELLFRKYWYKSTYELAEERWVKDNAYAPPKSFSNSRYNPYKRVFDLGEHHFYWTTTRDGSWAGYGAHADFGDYSGWNEKVSYIDTRTSTTQR